jgi:predicted methyltransferase
LDSSIDLKAAINAISDVIQNRPRPIREFDQIYMKAGDMVLQSEFVADWANNQSLAFVGDGDAISVCVAYLRARDIIDYGPTRIKVFDFDERIVGAINRFADKERLDILEAELYNCIDPLVVHEAFDCFYTNPPWGASNKGESVKVFTQRGMEAIGFAGEGLIVIADDDQLEWPREVLAQVQAFASANGFFVCRMMPRLHAYHLDDNPDLRSCNLLIRSVSDVKQIVASESIHDPTRLGHFYGLDRTPTVHFVREKKRLNYGMAHDDEYQFELLEDE